MSRERIDQLLTAWEERLRRIDDNLLALEAEPTYQMLAGAGGGQRTPLAGATEQRVAPALDALSELFEHRERLTEVLDRAKELRDSISALTFWNTDEKLLELEQLLNGPSIKMGTRPTPLAKRNLLSQASEEVAVVPEQLLQAMVHAYDGARSAVMDVQSAWASLEPAIERAQRDVLALRATAVSVGAVAALEPEIASVEGDLAALRDRVALDPLGVSGTIDGALTPRIAAVQHRIDALSDLRERAFAGLARAARLRAELSAAHISVRAAAERGRLEAVEANALPMPGDDAGARGLDPWLEKLESTARAGRWQSAEVGLSRWLDAAKKLLASDLELAGRYEAVNLRRAELVGRLSARRAQAQSLATRKGALDPALEANAREAEELLQRRPAPLDKAATLVESFEGGVIALARR